MLAFTPTSNLQEIQGRQEILRGLYATFSDTGKGYRSLNKTLANFPGLLGDELMRNLKHIHLTREINDRLELLVILNAIKESQSPKKPLNPLWMGARRPQLEKAMREYLQPGYSVEDASNISSFVIHHIVYEPPNFAGGIVGLAERVKKILQKEAKERRESKALRIGLDVKLAQPPSLPHVAGVTFIDTIARLLEEGSSMENCVMDHVEQAIAGEHYYFHLEKDGEGATVQIKSEGIYTCEGKHYKTNSATMWKWWKEWNPALKDSHDSVTEARHHAQRAAQFFNGGLRERWTRPIDAEAWASTK